MALRYGRSVRLPGGAFAPMMLRECEAGFLTSQFYLGSPQSGTVGALASPGFSLPELNQYFRSIGFRFNIHSPHVINMAAVDDSADPGAIIAAIQRQVGDLPGAIVVHTGSITKTDGVANGVARIVRRFDDPRLYNGCTVLIENGAGQGSTTNAATFEYGRTIDELRSIFEACGITRHLKVCIDTQHGYAAGMSQWGSTAEVTQFLDALEAQLPGRLQLIHLNGSLKLPGSHVDRHAPLAIDEDYIWRDPTAREGLKTLLEYAVANGWDVVSETSDPQHDLQVIRGLWPV